MSLIDREYAKDAVKYIPWCDWKAVGECLDACPTIDLENLRPKGEWINIMDFGGGNCIGFCSVCRTEQRVVNAAALKFGHRYCRWCGADMRGDINNE